MSNTSPKIAFVYDRVNKIGGAERVLEALHEIWPEAPLYTSVYEKSTAPWASKIQVKTSFLQRFGWARKRHEYFAWLMTSVFESFDFSKFDIVISVTSAEAKAVITHPSTLHICYLLTPTRYLWSHNHFYLKNGFVGKNVVLKIISSYIMSHMRKTDFIASKRPDKIVTISNYISRRLEKYYRRKADAVIYPPVTPLKVAEDKTPEFIDYYLVVSRLVSYKRIDLAIKACNELNQKLVIVGEGVEREALEKLAGDSVSFLGNVSDRRLAHLYKHCSGVLFPTEEDFGIVCVEAQAAGKPVVAYGKGGATEIIQNHTNGVFFDQQQVKSLVESIIKLTTLKINPNINKKNAERFSKTNFQKAFRKFVEESWKNHLKTNQ